MPLLDVGAVSAAGQGSSALLGTQGRPCYLCDLSDDISVCWNLHLMVCQCLMEFNLAFVLLGSGLATSCRCRFIWDPFLKRSHLFPLPQMCLGEEIN